MKEELEKLRQAKEKADAEYAKIMELVKEMYRLSGYCDKACPEIEALIKGRG